MKSRTHQSWEGKLSENNEIMKIGTVFATTVIKQEVTIKSVEPDKLSMFLGFRAIAYFATLSRIPFVSTAIWSTAAITSVSKAGNKCLFLWRSGINGRLVISISLVRAHARHKT